MRIGLALRTFFRILSDQAFAAQIDGLGQGDATRAIEDKTDAAPAPVPAAAHEQRPSRSDAITLLATLQREARFVDIVKEPLADYSDAQIGAAARDVLRDCGDVLDRLFALKPVVNEPEGTDMAAPTGSDAARFRLRGNVREGETSQGSLVHHGWEATRCELPQWTGGSDAALVVAPAELEVK